jgi:hypothetical protein
MTAAAAVVFLAAQRLTEGWVPSVVAAPVPVFAAVVAAREVLDQAISWSLQTAVVSMAAAGVMFGTTAAHTVVTSLEAMMAVAAGRVTRVSEWVALMAGRGVVEPTDEPVTTTVVLAAQAKVAMWAAEVRVALGAAAT